MKRRNFIRRLSLSLAAFAGSLLGLSFLRGISFGTRTRTRRVRVGKLSDFPLDTYTFVEDSNIYVYRDHELIKAVSAVCTHLGCTVQKTSEGFECPCHGSCYTGSGKVVSGPAPSDLPWYRVEKSPDGMITVDLGSIADAEEKFYIS